MIEITLTVTFAYATFFLAEEMKMSGVLAEVTLPLIPHHAYIRPFTAPGCFV